jgi:GGDEF domain-containing protein
VRLRESKQAIEALATRDAMTDTWNRRHIDALLARVDGALYGAKHARRNRVAIAASA